MDRLRRYIYQDGRPDVRHVAHSVYAVFDLDAEEQGLVLVCSRETDHERLDLVRLCGRVQVSGYDVTRADFGGVLERVPQHFDIGAVAEIVGGR